MDSNTINELIGALNLGLIISKARDEEMVQIPKQETTEIIMCLEMLRDYIQERSNKP